MQTSMSAWFHLTLDFEQSMVHKGQWQTFAESHRGDSWELDVKQGSDGPALLTGIKQGQERSWCHSKLRSNPCPSQMAAASSVHTSGQARRGSHGHYLMAEVKHRICITLFKTAPNWTIPQVCRRVSPDKSP